MTESGAAEVWNARSAAEIAAMIRAMFLRVSTYAPLIFAQLLISPPILPNPASRRKAGKCG